MRISGKIVLLLFFFFFFMLSAPSKADIVSTKIRSHNRDIILFSYNFAFAHTGYVSVAVSSVVISPINPVTSNLSRLPDPSRIGFFLISPEFIYRYSQELERNPDLCALDVQFISVLFTFRDLSPPPNSSFNNSYNVTYPGKYSLYFANCNDLSLVTMDVRTELYNTDEDGTTKDYLSADDQLQPSFYLSILLIYLCLLGFWISVSFKNQQCLEMIHLVMGVLLVMNIFHCICGMADQHDLKVTGTHNLHGWRILFYASHFMRDMYFFTVILLIGAGWCNWRRGLPKWVIINMTIVILLQAWANADFVKVGESGPYDEDWLHLGTTFAIMDFMCCILVFSHSLCSLIWFIQATDTSTFVRSYASLVGVTNRHLVFPGLLFVYIVFTRIPSVSTAIQEIATLEFSIAMFYIYRPTVLDDQDQKRAGFLDHAAV